jgi:ParB-like chromosome segregation protein Spo0J
MTSYRGVALVECSCCQDADHDCDAAADVPPNWSANESGGGPCEWVPVGSLRLGDSPRTGGVDDEHARALAKLDTHLPPIVVHRTTMRVIDGAHRLRAAELGARQYIAARFFDGDERDAFVFAVGANTANGLPLSLAERKAAAARIILSHPTRSDRWIALVSGLTATTVGTIRKRSSVEETQSNTRLGRDGRQRPVDSSEGRRLAGELMRDNPNRSLRDVARTAGIAPSTVLDVRNRLSLGQDPAPARREGTARTERPDAAARSARPHVSARAEADVDPVTIMQTLCRDPSLRFTEVGRALLRWLDSHDVAARATVPPVAGIPSHCLGMIAALARHNATFWLALCERIDEVERDRWPAAAEQQPRVAP